MVVELVHVRCHSTQEDTGQAWRKVEIRVSEVAKKA